MQYSGRLPSYIPPDEQHRLIAQAKLHSADAASVPQASKTPPPGFAGTPSFSSSTANEFAGDAAGHVAPSPDRGRQASGRQHHMPLSDLQRYANFSTCTVSCSYHNSMSNLVTQQACATSCLGAVALSHFEPGLRICLLVCRLASVAAECSIFQVVLTMPCCSRFTAVQPTFRQPQPSPLSTPVHPLPEP